MMQRLVMNATEVKLFTVIHIVLTHYTLDLQMYVTVLSPFLEVCVCGGRGGVD